MHLNGPDNSSQDEPFSPVRLHSGPWVHGLEKISRAAFSLAKKTWFSLDQKKNGLIFLLYYKVELLTFLNFKHRFFFALGQIWTEVLSDGTPRQQHHISCVG